MGIPGCQRSDDPFETVPDDPTAQQTLDLVATLDAQGLFYNAEALALLERAGAEAPGMGDAEHNRTFAEACKDPNLFRRLDRRYRFGTLLFAGDPASYRPLLDHLVQTRDWTLTQIAPTILVFERGESAKKWSPADLPKLTEAYAPLPAAARSALLVQLGNKLLALNETDAAKTTLEAAVGADGESAAAHTALALYHVRFRRWREAQAEADRALEIDAKFVPALATMTQLLFSTGKADEALAYSRQLVVLTPQDPGHLFLHAKITHQAHAFEEEISTLLKLVELAQQQGVPTAGYRIYLAQAHASAGQAAPAVQQFEAALEEGNLSQEQRDYIEESVERIRSRAPL
jgi:tetratricopeptide (TPR) repeat protein